MPFMFLRRGCMGFTAPRRTAPHKTMGLFWKGRDEQRKINKTGGKDEATTTKKAPFPLSDLWVQVNKGKILRQVGRHLVTFLLPQASAQSSAQSSAQF